MYYITFLRIIFHLYAQDFIAYKFTYLFFCKLKIQYPQKHENKVFHILIPQKKSESMKSFISKHVCMKAGYTACIFLGFALWGTSRTATITGTVKDQTGEPLPGVNIRLEGTGVGTITDADGAYSIDVQDSQSVLRFNYIGYAPQSITVGNRRVINVVMEEDVANPGYN
jgi:hypothetical protein